MIQEAEIVEDSKGELYLTGGQVGYCVGGLAVGGDGMGLRDLLAYVRGDTASWRVEEVTAEVIREMIGEVVAEYSAGVRPHDQEIMLYPGRMGIAAQEYILGECQD